MKTKNIVSCREGETVTVEVPLSRAVYLNLPTEFLNGRRNLPASLPSGTLLPNSYHFHFFLKISSIVKQLLNLKHNLSK